MPQSQEIGNIPLHLPTSTNAKSGPDVTLNAGEFGLSNLTYTGANSSLRNSHTFQNMIKITTYIYGERHLLQDYRNYMPII